MEVVGLGRQEMGQQGGIPSDWLWSTFYFLWLVQCWKQDKKKGSQWSLTTFWQSWAGYYGNSESEFCCQMWSGHCLHTQYATPYSVYQCVCVCVCVCVCLVTLLCPTLCVPMETLQARILEWVAMPFSRGSSQFRNRTQVSCTAGGFFTIWAPREALNISIPVHIHITYAHILSSVWWRPSIQKTLYRKKSYFSALIILYSFTRYLLTIKNIRIERNWAVLWGYSSKWDTHCLQLQLACDLTENPNCLDCNNLWFHSAATGSSRRAHVVYESTVSGGGGKRTEPSLLKRRPEGAVLGGCRA